MGKPIIRMSQSGYCPKRTSAMLLSVEGVAPPPWLAKAAQEGQWHEDRMVAELLDDGCEIVDRQATLELDYPKFTLRGHIDGRIKLSGKVLDDPLFDVTFIDIKRAEVDFSKFMLLEVKSFGFNELQRWLYGRFDAFPWYASQSTCYQRALETNLMVYAVKDRSGGARRLYVIRGEQASMPGIVDKLQTVVTYASKGQLAPAEFSLDSIECRRFCPFKDALCSPTKSMDADPDIMLAAYTYLTSRRAVREGEALANEAKEVLVSYARSKKVDRWQSGPYVISISTYPRETVSVSSLLEIMERKDFEAAISISDVERVRVVDTNEDD